MRHDPYQIPSLETAELIVEPWSSRQLVRPDQRERTYHSKQRGSRGRYRQSGGGRLCGYETSDEWGQKARRTRTTVLEGTGPAIRSALLSRESRRRTTRCSARARSRGVWSRPQ